MKLVSYVEFTIDFIHQGMSFSMNNDTFLLNVKSQNSRF